MKAVPLLDPAGAQAFGFDWLAGALEPSSAYGARAFEELRPFMPGEERAARARAWCVAALSAHLDAADAEALRVLLGAVPDAGGAIARASLGGVLGDDNFLELQRFCDAAQHVDALVAGAAGIEPVANDAVRAVSAALEPGRRSAGFYLTDAFDRRLERARAQLARLQAEFEAARGRLLERIARELDRDDLSGDEFIVMRADLHGGPPAGVRVVREAPTYLLCALAYDDATLASLERCNRAAEAVDEAEEAGRAALSQAVRAHARGLDQAARALGELDVLLAAARFTLRSGGCVAEIVAEPALAFTGGRFLPLEATLAAQGRAFTPIDVALHDVAVLTGPNMGGKSVCLRTCGFIALCAAFGVPVPAVRARTALFGEIAWLGIGFEAPDAEQRGGLLSSFAQEVLRLREVLDRGAARLLVLIDEFARTTTPHEGKALLIALLGRLRSLGACGLAATHLAGVSGEAGVRHFAVRGLRGIPRRPPAGGIAGALALLAASMDYTIAEVDADRPSGGDAIALAALLGLDPDLIAAARCALE